MRSSLESSFPVLSKLHCEQWPLIRLEMNRQACSPLIQLFFGFASDIDQINRNRDIRDGNWLSNVTPNLYVNCYPHVTVIIFVISHVWKGGMLMINHEK